MEALDAILTRCSIREYQNKTVPDQIINQLLLAAMSAPSAMNAQPWEFLVINDSKILKEIPKISSHADMAEKAPLSILVCGNLDYEISSDTWHLDCSASVQNLLLAAHANGLGAVWTAVYPKEKLIKDFMSLLNIPLNIIPHTLIPIGYPLKKEKHKDKFKVERIHYNEF